MTTKRTEASLTARARWLRMATMCFRRRPAETVMAVVCFVVMGVLATVQGCAHINSPSGFVQCMANAKDEAAAQRAVYALLDRDDVTALEAALALAPDAVRCLLTKATTVKGAAGSVENVRALKAKRFLDEHSAS